MTDKPVALIDDDDEPEVCPDCGAPMRPMTEEEAFHARMEDIEAVLRDAEPFDITMLLGMLAGEHIGHYTTAKVRAEMRKVLLEIVDEHIEFALESIKQHKREAAAIRRAGGRIETMPDVPATRQ